MAIYRVMLEPLAPLFRGEHSLARKSGALVHSDTLHAALVSTAHVTGAAWARDPRALRVSSIYPYWGQLRLLPKPFLPPRPSTTAPAAAGHKRWKKVRLVSEKLLLRLLEGRSVPDDEVEIFEGGFAACGGEANGKPPLLAALDVRPSVVVDRGGNGTTPFQRRGLRVNADKTCGLYFYADVAPDRKQEMEALVSHLGEFGLGGERSVGYGRFALLEAEACGDAALFQAGGANPNAFLSLSLYLPTRHEVAEGVLAKPPAAYECVLRGGWIHGAAGSGDRKRSLRLCLEGSVFPAVAQEHGEVRDTRPEGFPHPVWRSGLAFQIPFAYHEGGASR